MGGEIIMEDNVVMNTSEDKIKISEDVIATIAGIAASEMENLASMSGGFVDGIAGMLGRKTLSKGIKVDMKEEGVALDLSLVLQYGCKIHEVAKSIQERVRLAIEDMTGIKVLAVNINIIGLNVGKESKTVEVAEEMAPQA
jgi:uncharacterized alkaline shock family protein YloU